MRFLVTQPAKEGVTAAEDYKPRPYNHRVNPIRPSRRVARLLAVSLALAGCAVSSGQTPTAPPTVSLPTPRPTLTPRPTPTNAPPTVISPREARPTPTPTTYKVAEGDTLIPIANKFGISVEDLIAANNNLDATRLQIGQVLVIPSGPRPTSQPGQLLPSPTPSPYTIRGLNVYRTAAGSLECLGEIFNPGPSALTTVQLQITLLDKNNTSLLQSAFYVALEVVPPNTASPFRVLFTDPPPTFEKFEVKALRGEQVDPKARFTQMTVLRKAGKADGAVYRVSGEVQNTDTVPATRARVVVTTYDANRQVIGYRFQPLGDAPIAPRATMSFELSLLSASPNVADFSVAVEALRP